MQVNLERRRVLVTGAAGGIGSALVRKLTEAGASVFPTDVVPADGIFPCDVSSEPDVAQAFSAAAENDVVTDIVHASGICKTSTIADTEAQDWERILR